MRQIGIHGIWISQILSAALVVNLFAACAKSNTVTAYEPPAVTRNYEGGLDRYMKAYTLRTQDGKPAGSLDIVGTLVVYDSAKSSLQRCTVTHFKRGLLITNAHCADTWLKAADMRVAHWDVNGKVKRIRISSIEKRVKADGIDILLLKISAADAEAWNVFKGAVSKTENKIGKKLGESPTKITILAMNQMSGEDDDSDYSILTPKECLATPRTEQVLRGLRGTKDVKYSAVEKVDRTLFYDTCTLGGTIPGNSGSLIVDEKGDAIAIHHSGAHIEMYMDEKIDELLMLGASGKETSWKLSDFKALPAYGKKEYDVNGYINGSGNAFDFVVRYFKL